MVDPNHSLWLSASHLPALRLPMILTKISTKTDKSSFSQKRLISLSPHLIFRTTPFYFVTYSPFCNLIGLQYALQREQLELDQTLPARARGCGYARLGAMWVESTAINRLNAEFTRTPEHRNAILIFKRNHVAAASQQKQVLVRLTGILQA